MRARNLWTVALLSLGLGLFGCALDDADSGLSDSPGGRSVEQPVTLQPVFELEGLDDLPNGMQLEQLHLGVGAIFLDLIDSDNGISYANRTPFRLHFYVRDGQVTATAPAMLLPQGGRYQVSVQIEPQVLLAHTQSVDGIRSLDASSEEASLFAEGSVTRTTFVDDGDDDEPAPLPWRPVELIYAVDALQRSTTVVPFSVTSRRTVRFIVDEVELQGGSETELHMELQVGSWIEETLRPALYEAMGEIAEGQPSTERIDSVELDLGGRLEDDDDGMDGLIGGMKIELR